MNSRKCDVCNVNVHRASYAKHLRSKMHLENKKMDEMIIREWLFQEAIENNIQKIYNPKPLKQLAQKSIKLDDKQLNKYLAKKMINPYYFTDRNLKVGFKINIDTHHINHVNSKLTISPNFPEFGIQVRYIHKIRGQSSVIYARLINRYKFQNQTVFLAGFDKQDEGIQVIDETELFIVLNINHNLTESDLDNIDMKSPLEHQIQQREINDFFGDLIK